MEGVKGSVNLSNVVMFQLLMSETWLGTVDFQTF